MITTGAVLIGPHASHVVSQFSGDRQHTQAQVFAILMPDMEHKGPIELCTFPNSLMIKLPL